jgi:hypothetical protein
MIGNKFYTWFKNYYQWVGGAFNETLLLPLVRATNGLRAGAIRYDEVTDTVETYDGENWNPIPSATGFVPNTRTITINGETQDLSINRIYSVGTVTSVGLTAPAAFNVSGSPVTGSGTLALTAAGLASEYVRGDGTLANFPTTTGGGSSVSYYLNGSVNQGTFDGDTYYELSKTPILGAGTNFTINANGYIASFITDANDPDLLEIPAGNWNFEIYFSASSSGGNPTYYIELSKWDGSGFTAIASSQSSAASISRGTNKDAYFSALAVPQTSLNVTDRLAIRIFVQPSGRTITLHTENNNLCQVITTFSTGLKSINGLTDQVQYFATGTAGNDFNIVSANDIHTFNIPTASASNRGALNATDWAIFNAKQNALTLTVSGSSGASTLVGATLNVPTYTLSGLGGVASTRTITINGTAQDLSADRTYNVGTVTSVGLTSATSGVTIASSPVTVSGDISLSIATASGSQQGLLSSTDWNTFNNKQAALTLTTTGNSGASTLVGATLNVPEYTLSGLGGVPTSRTITINGTTQDLSADRTYNVGTVTSVGLTTSTTGVTIGSTPVTGSGNITIDIATASGSTIGLLSASDWTTFNNKQNAITLTTSGSSGAATLVGATLNIPQYQAAGNYITALTGEVTASGPGSASATLTNSAVIGKVLTGLNLTGGGTIAATDSILDAFGKVQNQISAMVGGVIYKGTWNASTNTPTLASGTGSKGDYYIVTVDGSTNLDGITDWKVGDWAIFNGTTWDKVDNTDAVSSVNGFTGAVSLSTSHINEGTNLYYTDARARAAISLTTTGDSGSATYTSGVLNVPTYTLSGLGGVPTSRTLTINGTAFDLSADRSWSVGTVTSVGLSSSTSGVTIGSTPITTNGTITLAIATASGSQQGLLSSTDWTTFNNKQGTITLTTNGTSGAATFGAGNVLNIPQYQAALTNPVTGTGTTNYIPKFTSSSAIGNSQIFDNGTFVGIGTSGLSVGTDFVSIYYNSSTARNQAINIKDNNASANGSIFEVYRKSDDTYLGLIRRNGTDDAILVTGNSYLALGSGNTERMRLDASGNLGLGVTPSASWNTSAKAFQVNGFNSIIGYGNPVIRIATNAVFTAANETYGVTGQGASYYEQNNSVHSWYTAPSGTAGNVISFTQAMTLGSNSGLSVGTTSTAPANGILSAATIQSNDQNAFWLNQAGNTTDTKLWAIQNLITTGTFRVRALNDSATNGINAIEISRSGISTVTTAFMGGNVGIGTTSPSRRLDVVISDNTTYSATSDSANSLNLFNTSTTDNTYSSIRLGSQGSGSAGIVALYGAQTTDAAGSAFFAIATRNGGTFGERLRITSAGNVGIGTTSPQARLQVNGNFRLYTTNDDGNELRGIFGVGGAGDPLTFTMYKADATTIGNFLTADGTSYFNGGNVGIGTTSPSTALHVVGAGTFSSSITTGAPSGGTAAAWKLGTIASTADRQVNRYIEVEVGGNSVWIHASLPD